MTELKGGPPRVWWDRDVPGWLLVETGKPGVVQPYRVASDHEPRGLPEGAVELVSDQRLRITEHLVRDFLQEWDAAPEDELACPAPVVATLEAIRSFVQAPR